MSRIIIKTEYAENHLEGIFLAEATVVEDNRKNSIARMFERDALREGSYGSVFEECYESLVSHAFRTFDGSVGATHLYVFEDGSAVEYRDWESEDWCSWTILGVRFIDIEVY